MNPKALIGAIVGAAIGAGIWGLIAHLTGYEVGYVAWGVGALVGFGAFALGGRGKMMGMACAALALASIFSGKMLAVRLALPSMIQKAVDAELTFETFNEISGNAKAFAELESEDDHAQFMVERGLTEAKKAEDVSEAELAEFRNDTVPVLRKHAEEQPTFEAWKAQKKAEIATSGVTTVTTQDYARIAKSSLGVFDIVFAVLGIATAYRVGSGSDATE